MFSDKMTKAMAAQVNAEFYSSYLYLSMNSYLESISMAGMASWMKMQAQEELYHGMKMYDFILERGGRVILDSIAQPVAEWGSPLAVFEDVYAHEQKVTGLINDLVDVAQGERDHATNIFLQWFITEQVEEEANVSGIVHKLQLIGNNASGLFALDQDLGGRVFTVPVTD